MSQNEQPKAEKTIDMLTANGRQIRDRMNEINDLHAFGHPAAEGNDKKPVSADEARVLEAEWEVLGEQLTEVCVGIFREQGGAEALAAVDYLLKNVRHHLDGGTTIQHRGDVLARIAVDLSKK